MSVDIKNNQDVKELANEFIEKLSVIANKQNGKNPTNFTGDIILEDEPGKSIKIENKIFYQMIYTDVKKLKKDSDVILSQYLDEIKPTMKSVDENVKELRKNFKAVETDVEYLMENRPKTFKSWITEKGKIADSTGSIFKFLLYSIAVLWVLSTALPTIFKAISGSVGINGQ